MGKNSKSSDVQRIWEQQCITQKKAEIVGIIFIVILLIFGIVFDLIKSHFLYVDNFSSISLTALQIQASISGISIALVALISGIISEEYYGISVSHYFLNIKPILFTQNRIMIGSICLVAINVGAYLIGAYNLVIAILWTSCALIVISVLEIYSVFKGKHIIVLEIQRYIDYILQDSDIPFEKKADAFSDYVGYWSSLSQNKVDYESEKKRYTKSVESLLEKDPEGTLKLLQVVSSDLVKKFMAVSDTNKKYRAIEVFEETYDQIWHYITRHELKHIDTSFELYAECEEEIILGMYELPAETFEKVVHWERLTDIISRINIYCHEKGETDVESLLKHMKQVRWIPSYVGGVLAEKRKNGEKVSLNYWKYARSFMFSFNAGIPDDVEDDYKKVKHQYEFAFYYSLIKNCQQDIASTIFKNHSLQYDKNKHDSIAFILLVICYTYYIAERESLACVTLEEKNVAKGIIDVFKNDNIFMDVVYTICWHSDSIDLSTLYDEMKMILNDYERMPLDGACKSCIVDKVASDFMLLIIVLLSAYGSRNNLVESVVTGKKAFAWYSSYLGDRFKSTEELLGQILQKLCAESDHTSNMLERGLGEFNSLILNKYKAQSMIEAQNEYAKYVSQNKNGTLIRTLEESLEAHLRDKCEGWLVNPDECCSKEEFCLLQFTTPISFLDENIQEHLIPCVEDNFIRVIINHLYRQNKLELFVREERNEENYFSVIAEKPYILVGPDFAFNPYNYRRRSEFDRLTSECRRINMGSGNLGMLLTDYAIHIGIEKVSVSTHHKSIDDCECEIDKATGLYIYSPMSGVTLKYTKEELEEYLHNEMIVLEISVKLNIMNPTANCGFIIERKYRPSS